MRIALCGPARLSKSSGPDAKTFFTAEEQSTRGSEHNDALVWVSSAISALLR